MAPVSKLHLQLYDLVTYGSSQQAAPAIIRSCKCAGTGGRDEIGSGLDTVGALGLMRGSSG